MAGRDLDCQVGQHETCQGLEDCQKRQRDQACKQAEGDETFPAEPRLPLVRESAGNRLDQRPGQQAHESEQSQDGCLGVLIGELAQLQRQDEGIDAVKEHAQGQPENADPEYQAHLPEHGSLTWALYALRLSLLKREPFPKVSWVR